MLYQKSLHEWAWQSLLHNWLNFAAGIRVSISNFKISEWGSSLFSWFLPSSVWNVHCKGGGGVLSRFAKSQILSKGPPSLKRRITVHLWGDRCLGKYERLWHGVPSWRRWHAMHYELGACVVSFRTPVSPLILPALSHCPPQLDGMTAYVLPTASQLR